MYVRGYLQGSENGRVVTIETTMDSSWWAFADINEDNTSSLLRSKDAAFCGEKYQLFKDYLLQKDEFVDFETFSK
jgi:hypothetical protein